jgi:hypothetical protein
VRLRRGAREAEDCTRADGSQYGTGPRQRRHKYTSSLRSGSLQGPVSAEFDTSPNCSQPLDGRTTDKRCPRARSLPIADLPRNRRSYYETAGVDRYSSS